MPPGEVRVYPTNPSVVNKKFELSTTFELFLITTHNPISRGRWMSHPESLLYRPQRAPQTESRTLYVSSLRRVHRSEKFHDEILLLQQAQCNTSSDESEIVAQHEAHLL